MSRQLVSGQLEGLDARGQSLLVRMNYGALLETVLWLIADGNARSQLPTMLLGDALLAIVRDWESLPPQRAVMLLVRVETANAAIVEADRLKSKEAPALQPAPPGPTRKGKRKPKAKAGRR